MRVSCAPRAPLSEYSLPVGLSPGPGDSRDWAWFHWASQALDLGHWAGFLWVQVRNGSPGGMQWGRRSVGLSQLTSMTPSEAGGKTQVGLQMIFSERTH